MRYRLRHDKLRRELARRRISQNRWAQMLGLSKSHLSMLVNGRRPYPEASTRRKLQEGLGVRLDELFEIEQGTHPPPESNLMESLLQDIRHGWRALRARPMFVSVIVLTLALGIGATAAMYSVIDATVLRPLPFDAPDRLVRIFGVSPQYGVTRGQVSMANIVDWRQRTRAFEALATFRGRTFNVSGTGEPERTLSILIADQYLEILGITPALGRTFTAEEHRSDGPAVAMISDAMWTARFDRDPAVLGRTLRVDTTEHVIVGVLPPEFAATRLTLGWDVGPDLALPLAVEANVDRSAYWQAGIGRLADGATMTEAGAEAESVGAWLRTEYPDEAGSHYLATVPLHEVVSGELRTRLVLFLGAAALVLMIGCINVGNLMLAYATSRRRETAVRKALGASKGRLIRLTLVESLMLALLGGLGGIALAAAALQAVRPMLPTYLPRHDLVGLDLRVLGFSLLLSVGTAVLFGMLPALGTARTRARDQLTAGITGHTGRSRTRLLRSLAIAQIAMAGFLAIGSGLVVKSYARLVSVDPGFESEGLLTFYTIPRYSFGTRDEGYDFVAALEDRLRALPGVTSVGEINFLPFSDNEGGQGINIEGRVNPEGVVDIVQSRAASASFFQTLGMTPVAGRDFTEADMDGAPVVIVDQTMADRFWPAGDALGQRFTAGGETLYRIIGVVPDNKWHGYDDTPQPHIFLPYREDAWSSTRGFVLRVEGDPSAVAPLVRGAVQEISPNQSIYDLLTMEQRMATSAAGTRFSLIMLIAFGATALLLAVVGTYGMFAYSIGQRTTEIGIRLALGADGPRLQRGILTQSLLVAAVGVGVAVVGSGIFTGSVSSFLFEVSSADPAVMVGASALMLAAGVAAAWLPARRAARVDPMQALRSD
jgi:predicted permease